MPDERIPVAIVGAGQAGLALSRELQHRSIEHVVLDRSRIGQSWRGRWDSFCLVTPNWSFHLPDRHCGAGDPDGFMLRDEIVGHLESYAEDFALPVRENVEITSIDGAPQGGFDLDGADGRIHADSVVLATGGYQKPYRPAAAASLPTGLMQIDAESYTNPDGLPKGWVLVVGSGQTGCQITEELHLSGRDVVLACGRAPWVPRRVEGRDIVAWMLDSPFLHQTLADLASPAMRFVSNPLTTGRDGGHDLHYRTLKDSGIPLTGRLIGADDRRVAFAPDLNESVAFGDARYRDLVKIVVDSCVARGEAPPDFPEPEPFDVDAPEELDLDGCGAVIFTTGFRPDYASLVNLPTAFDAWGFPIQSDGASTEVPGLFFIGTHFLRKRMSATLMGIREDAAVVAERIAARKI